MAWFNEHLNTEVSATKTKELIAQIVNSQEEMVKHLIDSGAKIERIIYVPLGDVLHVSK